MMRLSSLVSVVAMRTGLPPTIWNTVASAPVISLTRSTRAVSPFWTLEPNSSLPSALTFVSPSAEANPRMTSAAVCTRARVSVSTVWAMSRRTTISSMAAKATKTAAVTTRMRAARERRHQENSMPRCSAGTRRRLTGTSSR